MYHFSVEALLFLRKITVFEVVFHRFVGLSCKMVLCLMVDCSNKSGKVKGVSFHRVPDVVTTKGEFMEELTRERRRR